MADIPILAQLPLFSEDQWPPHKAENKANLHTYWRYRDRLPAGAQDCPTVFRLLDLLGPLDWAHFPDRNLERNWGQQQIPYAALAAAELIRLERGHVMTSVT